ncbi:MAG: hypothetical protein QOC82_566 [Frankiaceae bacterium]|jgi:hypothetical protein|nr:hypothetical protein [Frankiaceae bacterium]
MRRTWCSYVVQASAFRVEVIRFSLLVTLTVALLSVAIRLAADNDSHSSRPNAQPAPRTTTSAPVNSTAPSTSTPAASTPTASTPAATPGGGGGSGSAGETGAQPVLPVTGYDDAMKLLALSMVLIGGGAFTVRASRR